VVGASLDRATIFGVGGGIRVDGAPRVTISDNRVVTDGGTDIAVAGSVQLGVGDQGGFLFPSPLGSPADGQPTTGGHVTVSGNIVGPLTGAQALVAHALEGIVAWADATFTTVTGNEVRGHTNAEISLRGGADDTVTNNHIGRNGDQTLPRGGTGVSVDQAPRTRIGTTVGDGNIIGGLRLGIGVFGTTGSRLGGIVIAGNAVGSTDAGAPDSVESGIGVRDTTGAAIGPGNTVGSASRVALAISRSDGATVSGSRFGTDATGTEARGGAVGIAIGEAGGPDTSLPSHTVIGPGVRVSAFTDAGVSVDTQDVTITGLVAGVPVGGATSLANEVGVIVNRGEVSLSASRLAGNHNAGLRDNSTATVAIDGTEITGNGLGLHVSNGSKMVVRSSAIHDNLAEGIQVNTGGKVDVRTTTFTTNGAEPIDGSGALGIPVVSSAPRVTKGTQTRTWIVTDVPTGGVVVEVFGNADCSGDPEGPQVLLARTLSTGGPIALPIAGRPSVHGYRIAVTKDGRTSKLSTCVAPTTGADRDGDGVPDAVEDIAGSGSNPNAVALPTDDGHWIQLTTSAGQFSGVFQPEDPSPTTHPQGMQLPFGLVEFTIDGLTPGGSADVDVQLPATSTTRRYWMFGPAARGQAPGWYAWDFDKTTGVGAQFTVFNQSDGFHPGFTLHFRDGALGDGDGLANGTIVDPGGPGVGDPGSVATGTPTPPSVVPPVVPATGAGISGTGGVAVGLVITGAGLIFSARRPGRRRRHAGEMASQR
jgi:hypothetical protein